MRYLFQLLFLFCALQGFAQQWDPQTTLWWIYSASYMASGGDVRVAYLKDTLVQGHNCQVLKKDLIQYFYDDHSYAYYLLGNEVTYYASGVTYILNDNHFDTLYYFNGKIGDHYKVTDRGKRHPTDKAFAVIADTGSVVINNQKQKWQAVDYNFEWNGDYHTTLRDTIIERIGATKYYFLPWDEINGQVDANEGGPLKCMKDIYLGIYSTWNEPGCTFDLNLVRSNKYEPYIRENKIWKNVQTVWLTDGSKGANYLVNLTYFKGDTVVNGVRYSKLYRKQEQPTNEKEYLAFLMREDVINQMVFVYDTHSGKDELLYDFNLEIRYYHMSSMHYHYVTETDIVTLQNQNFKRTMFNDSIIWVEGIGAINEINFPSAGELICVTDNYMLKYLNPKYNNCDTIFTQGGWDAVKTVRNNTFLLYPNPIEAGSVLTVQANTNERLKIEIYSSTGALIKEDEFSNIYPIGSLNLKKGLYIYRISSNKKLIQADKLIVP